MQREQQKRDEAAQLRKDNIMLLGVVVMACMPTVVLMIGLAIYNYLGYGPN